MWIVYKYRPTRKELLLERKKGQWKKDSDGELGISEDLLWDGWVKVME